MLAHVGATSTKAEVEAGKSDKASRAGSPSDFESLIADDTKKGEKSSSFPARRRKTFRSSGSTAAESPDTPSRSSRCGRDWEMDSGIPAPAFFQQPACHRSCGESAPPSPGRSRTSATNRDCGRKAREEA